jgi:hypothetical protein
MPLILDQYGHPLRRRIGFLLNYAVNDVSDSETDAIGSKIIFPDDPDPDECQEGEPPQCR